MGALARSDAVFDGTVVAVEPSFLMRHPDIDAWLVDHPGIGHYVDLQRFAYYVTFDVHGSWKGPDDARITIETGRGGGDCGMGFDVGARYVVYASRVPDGLYTGICSQTSDYASAAADLAALGPARPVSARRRDLGFILIVAVVVALVTGVIVVRRRSNPDVAP